MSSCTLVRTQRPIRIQIASCLSPFINLCILEDDTRDIKHGKICFHFKDPIFSYCSEHFLNATTRSLHPRKWLSIGGSSKLHTSEPGNFPSFDSWMNELRRETKGYYIFFSVNGWSIKLCTDRRFPCLAIEFIWSKAGITLLKLKLTDHSMCF